MGEGSHVLYADVHNVHFSNGNGSQDVTQKKEKEGSSIGQISTSDKCNKKEDRSAKRGRQATKNFNKVNDVPVKGIGEKS